MCSFIPLVNPQFGAVEKKLVNRCLDSGWISSIGIYVEKFAALVTQTVKVKYALATDHGTSALHLALLALGIGSGDEVIVPALTFVATANAIAYTGAKPVFVDIDPDTFNLDLTKAEAAITSKTKAILSVDLYGNPVDYDAARSICRRHQLFFVSDSAESMGAIYKGQPIGGLADISIFSFYGNKTITTGEGGMLMTNSKKIYLTARMYRDEGKNIHEHGYYHEVIGHNYAMTNLQAAVGIGQLKCLKTLVRQKRLIGTRYRQQLKDISGLSFQTETAGAQSNNWLFCLLVDKKKFGHSRDELMKLLAKKGIETRPFFFPIPLLPPYKKANQGKGFPMTTKIASQGINLPTFASLTVKEISYICQSIASAQKSSNG